MKKLQVIIFVSLSLLVSTLVFPTLPVNAADGIPTIETIMDEYEVSADEAIQMQQRLEAEQSFYDGSTYVEKSSKGLLRSGAGTVNYAELKDTFVADLATALEMNDSNQVAATLSEVKASAPSVVNAEGRQLLQGSRTLSMPFYKQETDYYCGPAATQMALAAKGKYYSQSTLASDTWLETRSLGYTPGSYIKYTLNKLLGLNEWYVYREVNSDDASTLMSRVIITISSGYVPIVAVYQSGNDSRTLEGHTSGYLRHFVPIYAYADNAGVWYADSSSGLGGRFAKVPQKSYISMSKMSYLVWGGSIVY